MSHRAPGNSLEERIRGRLLALGAGAALVAVASTLREIFPGNQTSRWLAVGAALMISIHLINGYRGFRWIVAVALVAAGLAAAVRIVASPPAGWVAVGRLGLVAAAALALGPPVLSRPVGRFLDQQRVTRGEFTPVVLVSLWIVILAILAVSIWTGVGLQVFV